MRQEVIAKIQRLACQVRGLFPSSLPVGMAEFEAWAESIANTYDLPTKDMESVKFALAHIIMAQDKITASRAKYYFVLAMRSSASKQIAGAQFYEIKQAQQKRLAEAEAAAKAAEQQKSSEVTDANSLGASDESQK